MVLLGLSALALGALYLDPHAPVPARVADLLSRMTLEEKIEQIAAQDNGPGGASYPKATIGCLRQGGREGRRRAQRTPIGRDQRIAPRHPPALLPRVAARRVHAFKPAWG